MEQINQYDLYKLGVSLARLRGYTGSIHPSRVMFEILDAVSTVNRLLRGESIQLGVSQEAATELKDAIDQVWKKHFLDEKGMIAFPAENAEKIADYEWGSIISRLDVFENVFHAELKAATSYFIPKRGIYDTALLVERADSQFLELISEHVADKARIDFRAAGRCLALNLPTAAGFHSVRAVEGQLEEYYKFFSGKTEPLKTWHRYIEALTAICESGANPCPDTKTINVISNLKDDYRNPVVHPRVVLSDVDAHVLFAQSLSAISGMAQELLSAQLSSSGVQPTLGDLLGLPPVTDEQGPKKPPQLEEKGPDA